MQTSNGNRTDSLSEAITIEQYAGYAYAYPHKTSYRKLDPPVELSRAWRDEDKTQLYLYVHLPFCEMRCGFCNLFTASQPPDELVAQTLHAISIQSAIVANAIAPESIAQIAIGGGTPTYLTATELARIFEMLVSHWPVSFGQIPFSIEVSPSTVDATKLRLMMDHGVGRVSMGVQSFVERDLNSLGRPQKNEQVAKAIELIRMANVAIFNLDLIYGSPNQSETDWIRTVEQALSYRPEEMFLYPLYVRELTGLGRTGRSPAENRRYLYQLGRDLVLQAGYKQISMRMFRRNDVAYSTQHCCQEDGMIGLGPGARSYTSSLHYSSDYAVSSAQVRKIIADFNRREASEFAIADYGVWLNREDQYRRYLIRSLLQIEGLDIHAFHSRFGEDMRSVIPQVDELVEFGFAEWVDDHLKLNDHGLAHSDVIGPWLYSDQVKSRMEQFELR